MKKNIMVLTLLFIAIGTASAIFVAAFKSWNDLVATSPVIVIAKCNITPNPSGVVDGIIPCDIEVVQVLKGNVKPGTAHMASSYWPYQNEYFLMFANYEKDQFNKGYTAIESYRIIPFDHDDYNQYVWDHFLAGKPLKEQIQWILKNRLKDLNDEIARDNEEKQRIESGLDTNQIINVETNSFRKPPPGSKEF